MLLNRSLLCSMLLLFITHSTFSCELFTLSALSYMSSIALSSIGLYKYFYNNKDDVNNPPSVKHEVVNERCNSKWLLGNFNRLERSFDELLYGQPIVKDTVLSALQWHWRNLNPKKPLVLSFHGMTGVGKNHVSTLIIQALYKLGENSKAVTTFYGRTDFKEAGRIKEYQEALMETLVNKLKTGCKRQIFVFDEVDKIPSGILNILKPVMDYNFNVNNVDFRNSIFILISNTGGDQINKKYMALWKEGVRREDITYNEFERIVRNVAFSENGGLQHSDNIKSNLIDYYIPFLPLEAEHVKRCIQQEFRVRGVNPTDQQINDVNNEFVEYFVGNKILAKTGCKGLASKVSLTIHQTERKRQKRIT